MQRLKKCLGIDIGVTSVKIAEVSAEKSGVRVTRLVRAELPLPGSVTEAERPALVARAVKEALSKNKIATKQAVFCLPGQSVFVRRIRVPRTTEERLHRIVAYEARQQIPFALENSIMEYQVFDFDDPGEVEVLLVAIKKEIVTEFMKTVNRTGLKPVMISVSSLALFNFHVFDSTPFEELSAALLGAKKGVRASVETEEESPEEAQEGGKPKKKKGLQFNFPKLNLNFGKKKKTAGSMAGAAEMLEEEVESFSTGGDLPEDIYEEVRAYVNLGAQTFDLVIGRHGRHKTLGFTRSVPWSGNELTRSLQDKLGLNSFEQAEQVKRDEAIIILPGREDEAEEHGVNADASEFATSWADRMILDLRKSFDFYISQPDGLAVDAIQLTGGQAHIRNLGPYIEEKLGIPVDLKTQIENSALKVPEVDEVLGVSPFAIAMGLGIAGLGLGQVHVDFLPSDLKTIREFKKKNIEVVLLAAAILGMIIVGAQSGKQHMDEMERWLAQNRQKADDAQVQGSSIKSARDSRQAISDQVTALGQAIGDKRFWLEFLGTLESLKPADILIVSISMLPDGRVVVVCETELPTSISAFVAALNGEKTLVKAVQLSSPRDGFSRFIGKIVQRFSLTITTHWKKTRLAPARETLPPGQMIRTPGPTPFMFNQPPPGAGGAVI